VAFFNLEAVTPPVGVNASTGRLITADSGRSSKMTPGDVDRKENVPPGCQGTPKDPVDAEVVKAVPCSQPRPPPVEPTSVESSPDHPESLARPTLPEVADNSPPEASPVKSPVRHVTGMSASSPDPPVAPPRRSRELNASFRGSPVCSPSVVSPPTSQGAGSGGAPTSVHSEFEQAAAVEGLRGRREEDVKAADSSPKCCELGF
jgi:hypothetical protein